ncbi:23S rRNA (uracil(1939)-C(5))-methyltransferase RlmD [Ectobacillus ponti]|uniref:23S rRNA (Uracil(1939)-C(5))-methyltransferase RlmD n=1 Tax=Ectobacillus ponti TaxID=2961894 RepID=A0AA41XA04_9BACI|nr:23S rRNA (uracil(1939)-C(5))-methyltransferase RlmD [Ectobacillus ponti]MCP8969918.1 23S rRNA (uracil(1939)-C(5))-methyltransferase RlmD [Ectobacillus ponti]
MKTEQESKLQPGQTFPVTIKRLGINGEGVGYFKRQVVFIPGALPGEEVVAEVTKLQRGFAEAKVKRIRKASPHRVAPPCPVYEQCGGCQLQHLSYDEQLNQKRDVVAQAFERYTNIPMDKLDLRPTIGMEDPWHYRNKSQLQVGLQKQRIVAGLYGMNSHELIDISGCLIQHKATNEVTEKVKRVLERLDIPVYNERKQTGLIRTIVTRVAVQTGEIQLVLITAKKEIPRKEQLIKQLTTALPQVKSIMQNVNGQKTSLIFGEETFRLAGKEVIQETMGSLTFELSARAFFQLNPTQTVKLYDEVKNAAALTGKEKVVDAYCGSGTIGLWLADGAAEIRGMDIIAESIENAKKNAKQHGYDNTLYVTGKAEQWLPKWVKEGWRPDLVVVDPPRTGCDDKLLETILQVQPKKVVYVSCNPSTLAKDIAKLEKKYKVEYVQPVDMFPHTAHIENVALLIKQ